MKFDRTKIPQRIIGVIKLFIAVGVIVIFTFYLAPMAESLPAVKPMIKSIEEKDIDATAYYYTEIKEFSSAELNLINSVKYNPKAYFIKSDSLITTK